MAVSPDSACVAVGSKNEVVIWDLQTEQMILSPLGVGQGGFYSLSFSSNGREVAAAGTRNAVHVWDTATGGAVVELFVGHCVTFSHNGRLLVSGCSDETIRRWEARTGEPVGEPIGTGSKVFSVAVSPDDSMMVAACDDSTIKAYNITTGTMVFTCVGHAGRVNSVVFSPDGSRIASASSDGSLRIWNGATGDAIADPMKGDRGDICLSVSFSPDGRYIACASYNQDPNIWDANTGDLLIHHLSGSRSEVDAVAFTPDGTRLVAIDLTGRLYVWDVRILDIQAALPSRKTTTDAPAPIALSQDEIKDTTVQSFRSLVRYMMLYNSYVGYT